MLSPTPIAGRAGRDATLGRARAELALGHHPFAAELCRQLIARDPGDADARYCLGLALALAGQREAAIEQWQRVLQDRPRDFATQVNLGVALSQQGHHGPAIVHLRAALAIDATPAQVHFNLGNSLLAAGDLDGAIGALRDAIARAPEFAEARNSLGVAYRRAGRIADACTEFAAAIAADPAYVEAHGNLAAALRAAGEPEAAIVSWTRALDLDPGCTEAALALSRTLDQLGRTDEAITALAVAADASPDVAEVHYALAVALHRAGHLDAAVQSYQQTLALRPEGAEIWRDRARALESLQHLGEALSSYQRAAALAPEDPGTLAGIVSCGVRCCEWALAAQHLQQLRGSAAGLAALHPFLALSLCDEPAEQLQISTAHSRNPAGGMAAARRPAGNPHERIRVAYVSSDLRDHAIAHLLVGVLEHHDRDRLEVHAVSLQPHAGGSEIEARLRRAVQGYHDVSTCNDASVARRLRDLSIDIAVDLNGYTVGARPGIFAQRGAPVQVSYLGYAGTLGAPYMDYLLADEVVIPPGQEHWYAEQVVRLPHCYLPNDDRRAIGPAPTRAQAGLPETGVVLCAFTNPYKINPPMFDLWMRLLTALPGSVLWLKQMGTQAQANLTREAQRRGVAAGRLVFAAHVASMAEHLGRQGLADLYLDTLPYNAHSTACDALWAGVPVLTCAGRAFAARVAASALHAVGLPQLITHSLQEYEHLALELAGEPQRLALLRARLAEGRRRSALFDTARYTRHLEAAYTEMHARALRGEAPAAFRVAPHAAPAAEPASGHELL